MHRRARHLNPKAAGASLVLDARFITGLSNNDPCGSWSDRSGNNYTPTQGTAAAKPTYKTAQQGGNPVLSFDGGDTLYYSANLSSVNALTVIVVASFTNNTSRYAVFDAKRVNVAAYQNFTIEQNTYLTAGQKNGFYTSGGAYDCSIATASGSRIISVAANTTSGGSVVSNTAYHVNGVTGTLNARVGGPNFGNLTALNGFMVGDFNNDGAPLGIPLNGTIATINVFPAQLSGALLKRLNHAVALTWKIACS